MSKKYLVTQDQTVDGMSLEDDAVIHYTTCSTAAATAAKTAALSGFKLVTGAFVIVKFSITNTAASPTLNVNNTGAKAIRYKNAAITAGYLVANKTYFFVYDGTYWQLVGDVDTNTTYSEATQSAKGLLSAADKTKLDNTQSIKAIVEGVTSSLTASAGSSSIPYNTGSTKALVEIWKYNSIAVNSSGTTFAAASYGSHYFTGLSANMAAISAVTLYSGSSGSIAVAVKTDGSLNLSMADYHSSDVHYRVTWFI